MNKYIKFGGFLLVLVLAFLFFYPIERYVQVPCASCSTDMNTTNDCVAYLDTIKNSSDFISLEKSFGISGNNIDKTTKVISLDNNSVQCKYSSSGPIL